MTAQRLLRFAMDRFLLLPLGAAVALVWANTLGESYFRFSHALSFVVNDVAMALFVALMAQEVLEALMPGGALHTWRRWSLALVAAAGGIAGAATTFLLYVNWKYELVVAQAWPVACAIDIAASYYLLKLVLPRSGALPFVLAIGIVTNLFGLVVITFGPAVDFHPKGLLLIVLGAIVAATLRRNRVASFVPYLLVAGVLSWLGFYRAGIYPALALLPIVPFLPREPRPLDLFAERPDDDAVRHFEHEWNDAVQVIVFFFGLVNAGVLFSGHDVGTVAILAAALLGRPVGMLLAVSLAITAGLHAPRGVGWRQLVVVAVATSSGFTFALLFASGLLAPGPVSAQVRLGALATVSGALITLLVARALQVRHPRVEGRRRVASAHP